GAVRNLVQRAPKRAIGLARLTPAPMRRRYVDPFYFRTFGPPGAEPPAYLSVCDVASWETGLIEFEDGLVLSYECPVALAQGRGWDVQTNLGWLSDNGVGLVEGGRRLQITVEYEGEGDERTL